MNILEQDTIDAAESLLRQTGAASIYLPLADGKGLYLGSAADIAPMLDNLSGPAVCGEAVAAARAVLESKWDAEGVCESCGWHALLSEHHVDDAELAEALLFGGKLKLSCISKDDDTCCSHRGITIDLFAAAPASPDLRGAGVREAMPDTLTPERIFEMAAPFFAWNGESWRDATQGTIGMPSLLAFVKAVSSRAADAPSEPSELKSLEAAVESLDRFAEFDGEGGGVCPSNDGQFILRSSALVAIHEAVVKSRAADALDSQPTELPPLPESDWTLAGSANNRDAYTADQMREYGRQCASSQPTDGEVRNG